MNIEFVKDARDLADKLKCTELLPEATAMVKEPEEIFDIEAIAARNVEEAKLRASAFDLALRICVLGGHYRPEHEIAKLANRINAWFHTGEYPK